MSKMSNKQIEELRDTVKPVDDCELCKIAKCGPKCGCECHFAVD